MPTEKRVKGVVIPRHDTMLNWSKALNFVPAKGELIVYDADSAEVVANGYDVSSVVIGTTSYDITPSDKPRFKFGNGVDNVNVLPFATAQADGYVTYEEMVAYVSENGGTGGDSNVVVSETEPTDENVDVWIKPGAYIGEYIAESKAGTSATEWTYTVSSNNIFIGSVTANYDTTITTAEERVQTVNNTFPVTFKYIPAVTITLSNTDGDEHWIESQIVDTTGVKSVKFAMLATESATIKGTLNITVIGVVA